MNTLLLIIILLLLFGGSLPMTPAWGYGPSSTLGVILLVVLVLALTGRL